VENRFLYRKAEHLTIVPRELVSEIRSRTHDSPLAAHGGIHKTIERIRPYYILSGLVSDVRAYISACEVRKGTKAPNFTLRPQLGKAPESQQFFQCLFIDFLGPYPRSRSGSIGVFIVLAKTKYAFLRPVKKIDSRVVIKYLTFGVPEVILSDNGS